jgi:aryl-alcohol dehydrogenase-like predicted oxidoreductase
MLRRANKLGDATLIDGMIKDGLWDVYNNFHMGSAAELGVKKYELTRAMLALSAGNVEKLKVLDKVATRHNASIHQIALSWLLHHSNNILLIPGTSSVKHLEENMKSASIQLTDVDLKELAKISPVHI